MKRKRKVHYWVESADGLWWWCGRKRGWSQEVKGPCSSNRTCYTFDSAFRAAKRAPFEKAHIIQFAIRKGRRVSRDYWWNK